jgi:hypothetical protein
MYMAIRNLTGQFRPQTEGRVARGIEKQTSRIPSDVFLWSALSALGVGFLLQMRERRDSGVIVSQLAPVLLIMGLYNKLVKLEGHEREETEV